MLIMMQTVLLIVPMPVLIVPRRAYLQLVTAIIVIAITQEAVTMNLMSLKF